MKKVLVISYYWPPSGGSGVQRWVKMCKYLSLYGWQSVVYTPSNPALTATDETLAGDVPSDVTVLRRPIFEPGQFAKKATSAQVTPINGQKKSLKQRIAMWIRGNCFIPDPRVLWVGPSVRFLKKYLREHPVDAIVSTGPPHSMHLIARRVAAATGTPWVADFRDPWTKMFYFKHLSLTSWARRVHERLERKVLDEATAVVAVSPLVQADFRAMTGTPVHLITNGFDPDDFAGRKADMVSSRRNKETLDSSISDFPFEQADKVSLRRNKETLSSAISDLPFTLVHAGLFAADGNPTEFWEELGRRVRSDEALASSLRIVLAGKTDRAILDAIAAAGLSDRTTDMGYVSHRDVVKLMQDASMLLLPLRREPEYKATLPGKLFEYLASRRPVLGIGQKDGAMASILSSSHAGETFEWNEASQMCDYLCGIFEKYSKGESVANTADISLYSRPCLAEQYALLLDSITKTK